MSAPEVAVGPVLEPWAADAVRAGGGEIVPVERAHVLVWTTGRDCDQLSAALDANPDIRWVHVVPAGIESIVDAGLVGPTRVWSAGKGAYATVVAEHALALALALRRHLAHFARQDAWSDPGGPGLVGTRVAIVGGGGVAAELVRFLEPFRCRIDVVRRSRESIPGASVVAWETLDEALTRADVVVLALALTPETRAVIDRRRLKLMSSAAVLVNVARGGHVVTDDLIAALDAGEIAGAALDVTDPEPLPADHPLWRSESCLITPHTANPPAFLRRGAAERISDNLKRFAQGQPLLGRVDVAAGY